MKKRVMILVLAAIMIFGIIPAGCSTQEFYLRSCKPGCSC